MKKILSIMLITIMSISNLALVNNQSKTNISDNYVKDFEFKASVNISKPDESGKLIQAGTVQIEGEFTSQEMTKKILQKSAVSMLKDKEKFTKESSKTNGVIVKYSQEYGEICINKEDHNMGIHYASYDLPLNQDTYYKQTSQIYICSNCKYFYEKNILSLSTYKNN